MSFWIFLELCESCLSPSPKVFNADNAATSIRKRVVSMPESTALLIAKINRQIMGFKSAVKSLNPD